MVNTDPATWEPDVKLVFKETLLSLAVSSYLKKRPNSTLKALYMEQSGFSF